MSETIVAAALRTTNPHWGGDLIISAPPPARHHTLLHGMYDLTDGKSRGWDQGFVTSTGRYVDRIEGCRIARINNQIINKHGPDDQLFSEDMW